MKIMAEMKIQLLHDDCLMNYTDSMQKVFNKTESFLSLDDLRQLQEKTKNESLSKVSGGFSNIPYLLVVLI